MAGLELVANSGSQSLTADTEKTVLQIAAGSDQRVKLKGIALTLAGTTAKDLLVRVLRQTVGTGTSGTTITPSKIDSAAAETPRGTAKSGWTVEPTAGNELMRRRLQGGYEVLIPLGQEIVIPGGGSVGVAVTCVGATASVVGEARYEE